MNNVGRNDCIFTSVGVGGSSTQRLLLDLKVKGRVRFGFSNSLQSSGVVVPKGDQKLNDRGLFCTSSPCPGFFGMAPSRLKGDTLERL